MSTCYHPECEKERTEGGFCEAHWREMWTPKQKRRTPPPPRYDDTLCPCEALATRDGLCEACYAREWKRFSI